MAQANGSEGKDADAVESQAKKDHNHRNNDESKSTDKNTNTNNDKNPRSKTSNSSSRGRRRGSIDSSMTLDDWLEKNNFEMWKKHLKTYLDIETMSDTRTLTEDDLKEFFLALKNDKQEILDKLSLHEKISFKKKILKLAENYSSHIRRQSMNEIANSIQFLLTSNENVNGDKGNGANVGGGDNANGGGSGGDGYGSSFFQSLSLKDRKFLTKFEKNFYHCKRNIEKERLMQYRNENNKDFSVIINNKIENIFSIFETKYDKLLNDMIKVNVKCEKLATMSYNKVSNDTNFDFKNSELKKEMKLLNKEYNRLEVLLTSYIEKCLKYSLKKMTKMFKDFEKELTSEIIDITFTNDDLGIRVAASDDNIGLFVSSITDGAMDIVKKKIEIGSQIIEVDGTNIMNMQFEKATHHFSQLQLPVDIKFKVFGMNDDDHDELNTSGMLGDTSNSD